jgi:CheY-like chemotaxis protein
VGKGTGLGMSMIYGIVKQNDGFIYVESQPGKGATFKIYLPRCKAKTAQLPPAEPASSGRPTGTETVVLVEDDEAMLSISRTMLEKLGYTVLAAPTPAEALRLVENHPRPDLLMTDVVMPEMNGRELTGKIRKIRPGLKCLYMSGYTTDVISRQGILDEGVNFIQKPFAIDDLAQKIRQVLDSSDAG